MPLMPPTLHKPIPIDTRVVIPHESKFGTIVGIASVGILYNYIVLLDEPINTYYGVVKAVSISGCELCDENGNSFRIDFTPTT